VAQRVDHLICKHEALNSNTTTGWWWGERKKTKGNIFTMSVFTDADLSNLHPLILTILMQRFNQCQPVNRTQIQQSKFRAHKLYLPHGMLNSKEPSGSKALDE
jgi:hypothetical protein